MRSHGDCEDDAVTSPRTDGRADAVPTGQAALDGLVALLDLEPLELNLFRGVSPPERPTRVFGGQVAGQALVAGGRPGGGRGTGPGGGRPHGRDRAAGALAACVLRAPRRSAGADRVRGRARPRRPL